jgi:hypothetical protein
MGKGEVSRLVPVKVVKEKTTKRQVGDQRFLAQVGWCIETRLKVLKVMGILGDVKNITQQVVTQQIDWSAMMTPDAQAGVNDVDRILARLEQLPDVGERLRCGLKGLPADETNRPVNRLECKASTNGDKLFPDGQRNAD